MSNTPLELSKLLLILSTTAGCTTLWILSAFWAGTFLSGEFLCGEFFALGDPELFIFGEPFPAGELLFKGEPDFLDEHTFFGVILELFSPESLLSVLNGEFLVPFLRTGESVSILGAGELLFSFLRGDALLSILLVEGFSVLFGEFVFGDPLVFLRVFSEPDSLLVLTGEGFNSSSESENVSSSLSEPESETERSDLDGAVTSVREALMAACSWSSSVASTILSSWNDDLWRKWYNGYHLHVPCISID